MRKPSHAEQCSQQAQIQPHMRKTGPICHFYQSSVPCMRRPRIIKMDMCPGFHFWDKWEEEEESCRGHGEKLSLSVSACSRAQPCSMQTTAPSLLSPPLSGPPQPIVPDFAGCKHKGLASASCFRALLYQGMEGKCSPKARSPLKGYAPPFQQTNKPTKSLIVMIVWSSAYGMELASWSSISQDCPAVVAKPTRRRSWRSWRSQGPSEITVPL